MVDGQNGQNGIIATSHATRGRSAERDGVKTPPPCMEGAHVKGTTTSLPFAILKYAQVSIHAVVRDVLSEKLKIIKISNELICI